MRIINLAKHMLGLFLFMNTNAVYSLASCTPSQIHINQGFTPTSMMISWTTTDPCPSIVLYGLEQIFQNQYLGHLAYGTSTTYNFTYSKTYTSPYIHHVLLSGLKPSTQYFYICGDQDLYNEPHNFTTLPQVGIHEPISFGIIGDLGQTEYSVNTVKQLLYHDNVQMMLHAGDLSYADCEQPLWDSYGEMIEPLAKHIPWMVCPGNHEIEYADDGTHIDGLGLYSAFEHRYHMPQIKPAEFGKILIENTINERTGAPYCCPSIFQSEYNYGNSFYSFDTGLAHIIYLNPYSNTNRTSKQYAWLKQDLWSVDRTITPWIIVIMHCPWYNSNMKHSNDAQTVIMKSAMEKLFFQYGVNIVFSGHVHAYERTYPVYQNRADPLGPTYITIGDSGNAEGLDNNYYEKPAWSAFRNGTYYGYGILTLIDAEVLVWQWHRNLGNQEKHEVGDEMFVYNTRFFKNYDI